MKRSRFWIQLLMGVVLASSVQFTSIGLEIIYSTNTGSAILIRTQS